MVGMLCLLITLLRGVVYSVNKNGPIQDRATGDTVMRLERFSKFIQKFNRLQFIAFSEIPYRPDKRSMILWSNVLNSRLRTGQGKPMMSTVHVHTDVIVNFEQGCLEL